jgi:hypothetical protein
MKDVPLEMDQAAAQNRINCSLETTNTSKSRRLQRFETQDIEKTLKSVFL